MSPESAFEIDQTVFDPDGRVLHPENEALLDSTTAALGKTPSKSLDDSRIVTAIELVETRPGAAPSLTEVSDSIGVSPFHLHRLFADAMGETIAEYGRRVRLDSAMTWLCQNPDSILDVGMRAGYESQAAFTRAFARQYGLTPARMRMLVREASVPTTISIIDRSELVRLVRHPPMRLIGMRFYGGYEEIHGFWLRFAAFMHRRGFPVEGLQAVGILYDDPRVTNESRIRYDCCVMDTGFGAAGVTLPLVTRDLDSQYYAELRTTGNRAAMVDTVNSICFGWLPRSRRKLADARSCEFFHLPPWQIQHGGIDLSVMIPML